ncbi:MAG: dTMP kinase [Verrucomicrobiaceae bacterium]|nr:dTMP kinase [Verrucomicrobiaceae bacterium]
MNRPIPNGLLIAVEGIDGAGKTSVSTLLAQWCGENGLGCMISKEPTGNKWGTELRNSARAGRLTLERELELFALDRQDHVERSIRPALNEGNIVILDRYYYSTAAYQGSRGADYHQIIAQNESFAPRPDLVLVLNVDVDAGLQRIRMRGDKPNLFESKGALTKARNIFLQLAEQNENAVLIDASGHLKDTFPKAFYAFQRAAINKLAKSTTLNPDLLNRTLVFFGGEPIVDTSAI